MTMDDGRRDLTFTRTYAYARKEERSIGWLPSSSPLERTQHAII